MQVVFYKNLSENNRLTKSYGASSNTYSFNFKGTESVFNPTILVGTSENLTQYNYAVIDDLNRKYFISDIKMIRHDLYEISLHVDVLSTYDRELRSVPVIVSRNTNTYNQLLPDTELDIYADEVIYPKYLSDTGFTKDLKFILAVAGS